MADRLNIQTYDRHNLPTRMRLPVDPAATLVNLQAVVSAIDPIILGSAASGKKTAITNVTPGSPGPAASVSANRGNKWLVKIFVAADKGGLGDIYDYEIGTADDTQLPSAASDFLDLSAGVGLALKNAIEAVYLSDEGNTGVVQSVQQVNRSANN